MAYERVSPTGLKLGWVVCSLYKADAREYFHNGKYGYWIIEKDGQKYRRPDTYWPESPYDWEKLGIK
jgi:hypothetical protein